MQVEHSRSKPNHQIINFKTFDLDFSFFSDLFNPVNEANFIFIKRNTYLMPANFYLQIIVNNCDLAKRMDQLYIKAENEGEGCVDVVTFHLSPVRHLPVQYAR